MLQILMISIMIPINLILIHLSHPLAVTSALLMQTVLTTILAGMMMFNFWYSYITFLIFVGGLLILFMYITSISSNESFKLSFPALIVFFTSWIFVFLALMYTLKYPSNLSNSSQETFKLMDLSSCKSFLLKIYNSSTSITTLLLVVYLFLALVAVSKIIDIKEGPLRQSSFQ
uniref:NADH dehydrogenase subunit 6 n=1 Tax=Ellipes minuta TaxID=241046 RepID=E0YCH1_9ORTH|nr:NADH dehydrogenase subunit 6 [Ellipes minuta]ADD97006.1 NADH dehydrogenase subunit 6 [Ellipes minuta]